jgi:hypothetical protein
MQHIVGTEKIKDDCHVAKDRLPDGWRLPNAWFDFFFSFFHLCFSIA